MPLTVAYCACTNSQLFSHSTETFRKSPSLQGDLEHLAEKLTICNHPWCCMDPGSKGFQCILEEIYITMQNG